MTDRYDLLLKARRADKAWSAALEARYGREAGDARYDARGTADPTLAALAEAKLAADREAGL